MGWGGVGWGSSTRMGGGRKARSLPRKFVFLGFGREGRGMSREWGVQKVIVQKTVCARFSASNRYRLRTLSDLILQ